MDKRGSGNVRAPIKRKSDGEKPIGLFCKELYETGGKVAGSTMVAFCMLAPIRICLGRNSPVVNPGSRQNVFAD